MSDYLKYDGGTMTQAERANLDAWRIAWVEALRSGKYRQTRGVLRNAKGMCCLGVLCDVAADAGHGEWSGYFFAIKNQRRDTNIPTGGSCWDGDLIRSVDDARNLTYLNDDKNYSFDQIADVIESRNVRLPNGAIL